MGLSRIADSMRRIFPNGYWPKKMTDGEKSLSMDTFRRDIYPIWNGIDRRDRMSDDAKPSVDLYAPGQVLFETVTMHKQDMAIRGSGKRPNFQYASGEDERQKEAAKDRYSSWMDK